MDMNLFDYMRESKMESESPLASRLRPKTLDEVVGQQHIVGRDKLLYRPSRRISWAPLSFTVLRAREKPRWLR